MSSSFVPFLLLLLIAGTRAGVVISWKPSPSPVPEPSPVVAPWNNNPGNVTDVASSYIPLVQHGRLFNESVTVPMVERTDTTLPLPAFIAAEDFHTPLALQTCSSLVADLVLFRQLGRTGNYRTPTRTRFWLLSDTQATGSFNQSRALAERVFDEPSEGRYDPPGSTGGTTKDHGNGNYYHVERLRFVLRNLTLRANTTYWLAALVSIDRAYNASDFSQNTVRWAVSENVAATSVSENRAYRVVDWHHNTFRDASALANWTDASVAEPFILPFLTAQNVHASRTRQLALDLYVTDCTNVTRLPASLTLLAALPPRDPSLVVVPPSVNPSPSKEVVAVETPPSSSPSFVSSVETTPSQSPSLLIPSPSSVWVAPSPSLGGPSPLPPTPFPLIGSPSPSPSYVSPSSWTSPSPPSPTPMSTGGGGESPVDTESPSPWPWNVGKEIPPPPQPISRTSWIVVGIAALVGLGLMVGLLFFMARKFNGNQKYTAMPFDAYRSDQDEASNDDTPKANVQDASEILLDDNYADEDEEKFPKTREDAKAKQDRLLMQSVPLDDPKK